jgi:hypothetical protein
MEREKGGAMTTPLRFEVEEGRWSLHQFVIEQTGDGVTLEIEGGMEGRTFAGDSAATA